VYVLQLDPEASGILTELQQKLNAVLDDLSAIFAARWTIVFFFFSVYLVMCCWCKLDSEYVLLDATYRVANLAVKTRHWLRIWAYTSSTNSIHGGYPKEFSKIKSNRKRPDTSIKRFGKHQEALIKGMSATDRNAHFEENVTMWTNW